MGSYYETSDSTFNPNTAWGGTWSLETAGQVHVSAGTGYTIGSTGGDKDVKLTTNNIPRQTGSFTLAPNCDAGDGCHWTPYAAQEMMIILKQWSEKVFGTW